MNSTSTSNIEQSESQRIGRPKRISSIFSERDSEEDLTSSTAFPKLHRHTSIGRENDSEEPRFHSIHRLRFVWNEHLSESKGWTLFQFF